MLRHRKRTNINSGGYILKRRRWGTSCPQCLDWDLKESQQAASCPLCFGVGVCGGFFPAVDYRFVFESGAPRRLQRNENTGQTNDYVKQARGISYPFVESGDVYVKIDDGNRFIIQTVAHTAAIGTVPLIIKAELRLAPVTDIIYLVPFNTNDLISYTLPGGKLVEKPKAGTPGDPAVVPVAKSGVLDDASW